jgi:hypothetical protein
MPTVLPSIDVTMLAYKEPAIEHNIRSWLPHARKIVVVAGATLEARGAGFPAVDDVLVENLRIMAFHDCRIVVVDRDTYWKDKNEMAAAAAEHLGADIVWQVDADEFYFADDIERARMELADDGWVIAKMPHIIFWKDKEHVIRSRAGDDWFVPQRIWRRADGERFLHLPFGTIQKSDGSVTTYEGNGVRTLGWGRCYHSCWCPPAERIAFKFAYHKARGDGGSERWIHDVWENGVIPPEGVHPGQTGIFPTPFSGPWPPAFVASVECK